MRLRRPEPDLVFNPAPGWPTPPAGWTPNEGWTPDPGWPPAPPGWPLWVPRREVASDEKRQTVTLQHLESDIAKAMATLATAKAQLAEAQQRLVETRELMMLQEAGIYNYSHPLDTAVGYKELLARVRADTKSLVSGGRAVDATTSWTVEGSAARGRQMVADISKLLLRAYNAEADNCVRTVKPHNVAAAQDRLTKAATSIARLGKTMAVHITTEYHQLRLYEIRLTADYLAKVEEEKERNRAERERLREEQAAQRDFERETARLTKEQNHYANVLNRLRSSGGTEQAIAEVEAKLAEIGAETDKVIARQANIRAGYVYVISNIGAFGERMVKIGLTRRLDPMDRVRELGDASVPFRFDVHALIFSDDAVGLETRLHQRLEDRKVNRVNQAREFFYATPAEVRDVLADVAGQHLLEYTEDAEAAEWRTSQGMRES
jgi:hypothetical protein